MFCEDSQCGAMLGLVAVGWIQVKRQQGEIDGLFVAVFGWACFGQMYMVAVPVGLV